jgi:hypothetical protein
MVINSININNRLHLQLFVGGRMSYLRYLCLLAHSGVQRIVASNAYYVVFFCFFSSTMFLWIVLFWLPLRYFLKLFPPISTKWSITSHLNWTLYLLIVNSLDIASYKNMFLHYTMLFKRLSSYLIIRSCTQYYKL